MDDNDPRRYDDPIWYDRAEVDEPPGPILNAVAYLFLLLLAACAIAVQLYWLPNTLWCQIAGWIERRRVTSTRRL
ncbi:hypothetical protein MKK69_06700 [Methylobacterium sp. J-026]|uniref:hypothetical protein n=1 Tax=Methylobacterium sp. J-026 TaxID=2836624 RepID=UPI001FB99923|nr:hypothetical protein [Methylobacterium sp. J-026]MCJ2133759.1 hypothetical protein [Methylobacterium sp. J-026]